jgi:beta-galactosidase GanA
VTKRHKFTSKETIQKQFEHNGKQIWQTYAEIKNQMKFGTSKFGNDLAQQQGQRLPETLATPTDSHTFTPNSIKVK